MAFCLAAIWLLHPVHSAIVAYVSGRADSLALAGLLGGWLCWETARAVSPEKKKRIRALYALAFLLALAGCCSKEIGLAGMGFFILYLWLFKIDVPNLVKGKTTLMVSLIVICYFLLRQLPDPNVAPSDGKIIPLIEKLSLFLRAMGDYGRLFIYPAKLFMERQVSIHTGLFTDAVKNDALFPCLGWMGGAFLIALTASLLWKGEGRRLRLLGVLWFGIMILPVSNLFTLNATVAEHWLYIPSIGLYLWLAGCWLDAGKIFRRSIVLLLPVAIVCLGLRTHVRAGDWKDGFTFYRATIRDGGDSIRVRINLAGEYEKMNKLDESERIYRSILKAVPDFSLARVLLIQNLLKQQRPADVEKLGAKLDTHVSGMAERSATVALLTQSKQFGEAAKVARQAYEANPNSWSMAKALAQIYKEQNQTLAAIQLLNGYTQRNWWNAAAQNELAELCVSLNEFDVALPAYLMAARLDIRDPEPLAQAAVILAEKGDFSKAIALQEEAVSRDNSQRQREILDSIKTLQSEKTPAK
ncbi:MAG: hypothetical protein ABIT76_03180 [Chthoniobacterales bacterium]